MEGQQELGGKREVAIKREVVKGGSLWRCGIQEGAINLPVAHPPGSNFIIIGSLLTKASSLLISSGKVHAP